MSIKRNNSIDLLRILCSIMVIIEHFCEAGMLNGFGAIQSTGNSMGYALYVVLYSFSRCAVDVFVIISGYFMIKKTEVNFGKVISLFIMTILFNELSYIVCIINGTSFFSFKKIISHLIPGNYYLSFYCVLYVISPFLNKIIKGFTIKKYTSFIILLLAMFSLWPTFIYLIQFITSTQLVGSFPISLYGTDMGFNLINFILLYFIGGYVFFCKDDIYTRRNRFIILSIFGIILSLTVGIISTYILNGKDNIFRYYDNPFIILLAVSLFILFINLEIKDTRTIIYEMGNATFGVFLIHLAVLKSLNALIPIEHFINIVWNSSVITFLFYVSITYFLSIFVSVIYNKISKYIRKRYLDDLKVYQYIIKS